MTESRQSRWRRRAVTIPSMLGATIIALLGLPLWVALATVADLTKLRFRLPTVRVYFFLLQYLVNDSVEILLAPITWAIAGFGTRLGSASSIARHERIQNWSLDLLVDRADRLLNLRVELDERSTDALLPGPVIVIGRHASLFDASLSGLLYSSRGVRVRGVIMAELLADPGFDLIYGRLGSVFIPRDNGPGAVSQISAMTERAEEQTAYVIFPEGRLFHPKVRDRSLAKLAQSDPARASQLAELQHVLPPRPGGLLALLDALPTADVVMVHHRGLDRFRKLKDLVDAVPISEPVSVTVERIPRSRIPIEREQQIKWLDDLWLDLDAGLGETFVDRPRA